MIKIYITGFISSFVLVLLFTPLSFWLAKVFNVYDQPDARKVHTHPIPRWGGFAIFFSILVTIIFICLFSAEFKALLDYRHKILDDGKLIEYLSIFKQLSGIFLGAAVIFVLGIIDDKKSVPSLPKLLVQIIAGYIALDYGVRISGLQLPFSDKYFQLPLILSQAITIFWIISFVNIVNLVDGLDGLAAGLVAIIAGTFLVVAVLQGETRVLFYAKQLKLASVISACLFGACLAFLFFNFSPAKIFLGDGGALTLGYLLGAITIIGTLKTAALVSFIIPLVVVALPTIDVLIAIIRRMKNRQPIMMPDKGHMHHRLLAMGWTQKEIVLLMYVITLVLSIVSILITVYKS
ncbi:MAG: MraY family glycosyltransferase [bacterium]